MSPEEAALLAGIAARPTDRLGYLVYADWLDERGDPRGEFLRLSAQLLEGAARLAELKPTLPADWVAEANLFSHAVEIARLPYSSYEGHEVLVWAVPQVGDRVTIGDPWFEVVDYARVVTIHADVDGVVLAVFVGSRDRVEDGALLAVVLRV